jgi:hypothetical protein
MADPAVARHKRIAAAAAVGGTELLGEPPGAD